jgi:hypothetical protein
MDFPWITRQIFEYIGNNSIEIINLGIVFYGVCIAKQGLTTWRKQLKGQDEYKLSIEIMETVYDLEERLRYARGRLFTYKNDELEIEEDRRNARYKQHVEKINYMLEAKNKLRALKLRADAIWERNEPKELQDILQTIEYFVIDFDIFYEAGWDEMQNRRDDKEAEEIWQKLHGVYKKDVKDGFWEDFRSKVIALESKMKNNISA